MWSGRERPSNTTVTAEAAATTTSLWPSNQKRKQAAISKHLQVPHHGPNGFWLLSRPERARSPNKTTINS
jgi:hypothetical protein